MIWRSLCGGLLLGAVLLGCGSSASPSPSVAPPSAAGGPPVASGTGIVLDRTPPIGCDAVGVDYTSATIRIDPASDPDVWAETEAAKKLAVKWTDGFTRRTETRPRSSARRARKSLTTGRRSTFPPLPTRGWRGISSASRPTRCTSSRPIRSSPWTAHPARS